MTVMQNDLHNVIQYNVIQHRMALTIRPYKQHLTDKILLYLIDYGTVRAGFLVCAFIYIASVYTLAVILSSL